ncbi:MAG: hypothetical protein IPM64_14090 [Phycisphaerales bacterium]|nr:hypothetical protein [Phycisphaerales bacterium]
MPDAAMTPQAVDRVAPPACARTPANRTLAALRDALLPKLISGELRIEGAEKIVGASVMIVKLGR